MKKSGIQIAADKVGRARQLADLDENISDAKLPGAAAGATKEDKLNAIQATLLAQREKQQILAAFAADDSGVVGAELESVDEQLKATNLELQKTVDLQNEIAGKDFLGTFSDQVKGTEEALGTWNENLAEGALTSITSTSDALVDMAVAGNESFTRMRDVVRNFVSSFLSDMAKVAAQKAILSLLGGAGSKATGTSKATAATGLIGFVGGLFGGKGSAKGSVVNSSGQVKSSAATGGIITGPGSTTSDSIPAMVMNNGVPTGLLAVSAGEAILNAKLVKQLGADAIHRANKGALKGFASGGLVGSKSSTSMASVAQKMAAASQTQQAPQVVKVVNAWDTSAISDYMTSSEGDRVVLNSIQNNPDVVLQSLNGG